MLAPTTHRDLHAGREALTLVEIVYRATANFPQSEPYGLVNQIRRCAISVPSNPDFLRDKIAIERGGQELAASRHGCNRTGQAVSALAPFLRLKHPSQGGPWRSFAQRPQLPRWDYGSASPILDSSRRDCP